MFDEGESKGLLRRSLLWRRGYDTPSLTRINFPDGHATVPSWSWMAYTGGINYLDLDFGGLEWEDLQSPWSRTEDREGNNALTAKVRGYDRDAAKEFESSLIFDAGEGLEPDKGMCVVLGVQKGLMSLEDKRHYLLLIVPTTKSGRNGSRVVERIGVGYLPGKCITSETSVVSIH